MNIKSILLAGSCLATCAMGTVSAQDANTVDENFVLDEIIVTAQKRAQNLQDVGISVTAISGAEIAARGISNSIDLIISTPSVDNYSPFGPGSSANIVVRGVGLNDFGEGHEAPVTVYVDEFYILSVPAVDFSLYDLDRVEVLRGPQGTLFGRNSTGGLVQYLTRKPEQEFGGYARLSYARFDEVKIEGAVNAPITEKLSGRISFLSHSSEGYIENLNSLFADERGGQAGTDSIRGQLRYEDDGLDVVFKAEYGRQNRVHTYYESTPSLRDPVTGLASLNPTGTDSGGYNEANFGAGDPNVVFSSTPQRLESDSLLLSLRVDKDISDTVTLTSITGYLDLERQLREDCDAGPNDLCSAEFPYSGQTFTQELRFSGDTADTHWQAGVYGLYAKGKNNPSAVFNIPVSGPTAVDPDTGLYNGGFFPISLAANWELDTYSFSLFGQVEHNVTDDFKVIAGARVTHDIKDFVDSDNASLRSCPGFPIPTNCFAAPDGPGIANPFVGEYDQTLFSGRFELNYNVSDDVLLFASFSRGTKAGGFNNGFAPGGVQPEQIPYDDETLLAYEAGLKSTLADGRVRFNASAFYYDYSDFQTFNWEGVGGLIVNQDAENYGAEVELEAALTENLSIRAAGSYLETEIQDVRNGTASGGTFTADREAANAPKWTANGAVNYRVPFDDGQEILFNWNWNYRSSRFANNFNDPSVLLEGYFRHNADVTYVVNDQLDLQLFVRNIGNITPATKAFQFNDLGYTQFIYSEPRVFGGSVSYNF